MKTDTTAGRIVALLTIPAEWLNLLAKKASIDKLIINLQAKMDI